jgi:thiamine-phosphate pyrophosphorylase
MSHACRLYLLTPPVLESVAGFCGQLEAALAAGDVEEILPLAHRYDVPVLLNDRPDLAAAWGCDGAHVGQTDMACAEARRLLGTSRMLGVTCHDSRHLAMEAAEAGADYVAFGAFFPTTTKAADAHAEPEILSIWQETMQTPCVAIGGVTAAAARSLAAAGADFLAVSAGVWSHPGGPAAAITDFNVEMARGVADRARAEPSAPPPDPHSTLGLRG